MVRNRSGLVAVPWVVTGALFALYPILRPYHDETTLAGAAGMASGRWIGAHSAGMLAFVGLTAGVWVLTARAGLSGARPARVLVLLSWLGSSLVLPYYGAEAFALHVVGARAVRDHDPSLLELANAFRFGAVPMIFFGTGLILLAAAGVMLAVVLWRSDPATRLAGLLTGTMLVLYLPQFFGDPAVRMGHGLLLALGCIGVGLLSARRTSQSSSSRADSGSVPEQDRSPLSVA